jgi:hypothetical protein
MDLVAKLYYHLVMSVLREPIFKFMFKIQTYKCNWLRISDLIQECHIPAGQDVANAGSDKQALLRLIIP